MLKILIDADILVYRIGYTTEDAPENIAAWRMDESINGILESLRSDEYECYLTSTDHSNYRYSIYPDYKANRKQPKPLHYDFLRSHLIGSHEAKVVTGMEADDQLGIDQTDQTCIASIDKDLNQIPGKHFNFVKGLLYDVSPEEGLRSFYTQLLTGDKTDNIPGIYGVGPVTAEKILNGWHKEEDLWKVTYKTWREYVASFITDKELLDTVLRNARLLKIRQTVDEPLWIPPNER